MDRQYEMVKRFHAAAGIEMPKEPTMLTYGFGVSTDSFSQRVEELSQTMKRVAAEGIGGEVLVRAAYVLEEQSEFLAARTIEDQIDALIDSMYFIMGTLTLMGVKPERLFDIVAGANLAKIQPDGTVLRHPETKKIMKPPGWEEKFAPEPLLLAEIERQSIQSKGFQGGD